MPLINYYSYKYEDLTVVLSETAKPIYDFYLQDKPHIKKDYRPNILGGEALRLEAYDKTEYDWLLHDKFDVLRHDQYKRSYYSDQYQKYHWNKKAYVCYDIDFNAKVNYFEFSRDHELESNTYTQFIDALTSDNSSFETHNYSLYHDNMKRDSNISKEEFPTNQYVNLNQKQLNKYVDGISDNPFSMIKVLMHANEIHLTDSFWASFCYSLDAKYHLLKNSKIYLYPFTVTNRWGGLLKDDSYELKLEPISLSNWTIKKS